MKIPKTHRVVDATFCQVSSPLGVVAMERAENEGWPMLPDFAEALPSVAQASVARRVAHQVVRHFRNEYRFWSGLPEVAREA